jgi:hypothetical protein
MSMTGNYVAVDNDTLQQVMDNTIDLMDIDPELYPTLDIDQSWEAIHFLLCGTLEDGEPPLGYVVPLHEDNYLDVEMEYGAYHLDNGQVKEALSGLRTVTEEELRARFDIKTFVENDVYPVVEDEDGEELFNYLYDHLQSIQAFYGEVADSGRGVIFFVS